MADAPPKVKIDPNSPAFDSMDEAADAVSKGYSASKDEKLAVLVKRPDGKYVYSETAPGNLDSSSLTALLPHGHSIAAIVHSHPGDEQSAGMFSPGDLATATQMKVPSYIRFGHDNSLRQFVPGKTRTTLLPNSDPEVGRGRVSYGDPVMLKPPATGGVLSQGAAASQQLSNGTGALYTSGT